MIIYMEFVLFVNILIHLILVFIACFIFNTKINEYGLTASLFIDAVYLIFYYQFGFRSIYLQVLVCFIISCLSFRIERVKCVCFYLFLNFCLGGFANLITLSFNYYFLVIILFLILLVMYFLCIKHKTYNEYLEVTFFLNDYVFSYDAFIDTGCSIYYKFKPVLLLKTSIDGLEKSGSLLVDSINGIKSLDVYKCLVEVKYKGSFKSIDCYIAFSNIEYDCLVGRNLIGGF